MVVSVTLGGSTERTNAFLTKMESPSFLYSDLTGLAQRGVYALQAATPIESSLTSQSWGYQIDIEGSQVEIAWLNTNKAGDTSVAILLQYGHGTGTGGYVAGRDYINGALKPIFDEIEDSVWGKVKSA